jgi:2-oxoglutarate dehydrogenase E2 component (dihydrolipoamide succinyltransferase)
MTAIKVPPLGESIVEATVSRWLKKEGDQVAPGETLVELETDKVTVEVPAMSSGVLTKRAHAEGDVVRVNDLLAEIDESAVAAKVTSAGKSADAANGRSGAEGVRTGAAAPSAAPPTTSAPLARPSATQQQTEVKASPAARRAAAEQGVDLSTIAGSGRGGVISKSDLVEHRDGGATAKEKPQAAAPVAPSQPAPPRPATLEPRPSPVAPRPPGGETREKMSTRRRRIAEHLLEAQHATAHLTTFNEIDMSAVSGVRERLKERIEKQYGVKLSFMPFFVKAACIALRDFPVVNAQIDGDSIVYKHYVNMGIAVASDAGLVVPNIKDADQMGMIDIARDIVEIAKRARDGKLTMDDLTGGTFTITNGGVFGSLVSTPILNYPQVGILGLHKIQDRPIAVNGAVVIRPMMYVALSYDHRIIDGQQAVLFLVRIKELMEDPAAMLVV